MDGLVSSRRRSGSVPSGLRTEASFTELVDADRMLG